MPDKVNQDIINRLTLKSVAKYQVYNHTLAAFEMIKKGFKNIAEATRNELDQMGKKIPVDYKERGKFEVEIKAAGDLLIAVMHTNVFEFPKSHLLQQTRYIKENPLRSYTGVIYFYNFLADSFKYNRVNDAGYLVGRLFVNMDNHFFVEGKRQLGFLFNDFINQKVNEDQIKKLIEAALVFSIDFDLLVPPYEHVKEVSVREMNEITSSYSLKTGKRLGFQFNNKSEEIR